MPASSPAGAPHTDTCPQADLNLGVKTFLNGALVSNIVLDTSAAATDTIDYVVTDPTGLSATSTRTILIEPVTPPSAPSTTTATSTPAATSSLPILDAPPLVHDYNASTTVDQAAATSSAQ